MLSHWMEAIKVKAIISRTSRCTVCAGVAGYFRANEADGRSPEGRDDGPQHRSRGEEIVADQIRSDPARFVSGLAGRQHAAGHDVNARGSGHHPGPGPGRHHHHQPRRTQERTPTRVASRTQTDNCVAEKVCMHCSAASCSRMGCIMSHGARAGSPTTRLERRLLASTATSKSVSSAVCYVPRYWRRLR